MALSFRRACWCTNTNSKGVEKVRNAFSAGVNAYGIVKGVGGVLKLWLQNSSLLRLCVCRTSLLAGL